MSMRIVSKSFTAVIATLVVLSSPPVNAQTTVPVTSQFNEHQGDALVRIRGIGINFEQRLKLEGIATFQQIASWTNTDIEKIARMLRTTAQRIKDEGWKEKAQLFARLAADNCLAHTRMVSKDGVHFDIGQEAPDTHSIAVVERIIGVLLSCSSIPLLKIEGHTDSQGDKGANAGLSSKRAQWVRERLVSAGIPAEHLRAIGHADEKPFDLTAPDLEQWRNRRVEIIQDKS
jgi:outer membrane protein OmpA-like peptidoglycan-associated protein